MPNVTHIMVISATISIFSHLFRVCSTFFLYSFIFDRSFETCVYNGLRVNICMIELQKLHKYISASIYLVLLVGFYEFCKNESVESKVLFTINYIEVIILEILQFLSFRKNSHVYVFLRNQCIIMQDFVKKCW